MIMGTKDPYDRITDDGELVRIGGGKVYTVETTAAEWSRDREAVAVKAQHRLDACLFRYDSEDGTSYPWRCKTTWNHVCNRQYCRDYKLP
jgi:hypothetical protein